MEALSVIVSPVTGEGIAAHRLVRAGDWSFTLWEDSPDGEPRVRDIDAAERLGFTRPRDIRKLIERIWTENKRPQSRATVARQRTRHGGEREYTVQEYWLTEAQVLKVIARAETPVAEAILDRMIEVYMAVRRHLTSPPPAPPPPQLDPVGPSNDNAERAAFLDAVDALSETDPYSGDSAMAIWELLRASHTDLATMRYIDPYASALQELAKYLLDYAIPSPKCDILYPPSPDLEPEVFRVHCWEQDRFRQRLLVVVRAMGLVASRLERQAR